MQQDRQQVEATMVELEQLNNEMKQISAQQQIASRNSEGPYQVELELEFEDDDSEAINYLTIQLNGENQLCFVTLHFD